MCLFFSQLGRGLFVQFGFCVASHFIGTTWFSMMYLLIIQHSYGKWPIYRWFMVIYLLTWWLSSSKASNNQGVLHPSQNLWGKALSDQEVLASVPPAFAVCAPARYGDGLKPVKEYRKNAEPCLCNNLMGVYGFYNFGGWIPAILRCEQMAQFLSKPK